MSFSLKDDFVPLAVGSSLGGLTSTALYRLLRAPDKRTTTGTLLAVLSGAGAGGFAGKYFKDEMDRVTAEMREAGEKLQDEFEKELNS